MLRHWIFNFPRTTLAATLGTQCCSIHHSANFRVFFFFPMLRHWVFNAAALKLLPISVFLLMLRHWVSNAAAFIPFFLLCPFYILSFFFWFQCSSYHLQHKIPRKCVQDDNNTNKITKYEALKHIKFHSYQFPHT